MASIRLFRNLLVASAGAAFLLGLAPAAAPQLKTQAPAGVQFPEPQVTISFDTDSPAASAQRAEAFADAAQGRYLVAGAHLSFPGIGHIRKDGSGYAWVPVDYNGLR